MELIHETAYETPNLRMMVFEAGPLGVNTVLLQCVRTGHGVMIDPAGMAGEIQGVMEKWKVDLRGVYLTHAHFDHVMEVDRFVEQGRSSLENRQEDTERFLFALHTKDRPVFESVGSHVLAFGLKMEQPRSQVNLWLEDGQELQVGELQLRVIHTPGHSPGSVCYLIEGEGIMLTGDTLFAGGVGRTDLPGGNPGELKASIMEKIFSYPDSTTVVPGHAEFSTIGFEKKANPFVQDWNFI